MTDIRVSISVDTRGIEVLRAAFPEMKSHNEIISMLVDKTWRDLEIKPASWPKPVETWLKVNNGYRSKAPDGRWALIMMNFEGKLFGKWDNGAYVTEKGGEYTAEEIVNAFSVAWSSSRIKLVK